MASVPFNHTEIPCSLNESMLICHFDNDTNASSFDSNATTTTQAATAAAAEDSGFAEAGYFTAMVIIVVMVIVSNIFVIVAIIKYEFLHTITNRFVMSLAIADLTVGLSTAFFMAVNWIITNDPNSVSSSGITILFCFLRIGILDLCMMTSVTNLLGVTIDRYIAVIYPLHYPMLVTGMLANIAIIVSWTVAAIISLLPMFVWHNPPSSCLIQDFLNKYHMLSQTLYFFGVLLIMLILYSVIFKAAWSKSKVAPADEGEGGIKAAMKKVRVFVMVFGALLITLSPFYIIYTYMALKGITWGPACPWCDVLYFIDVLMIGNSTMNPLIYAWKYKEFKRAFKKMLGCER